MTAQPSRASARQTAAPIGLAPPVLVQRGREVARAYGTLETPSAFVIDASGTIVAPAAT